MELNGNSMLQVYQVFVENEEVNGAADVPRQPTEEGISITDHVERDPQSISIEGLLVRPTKERVDRLINALEKYMHDGELVTYEGRKIYTNLLIESFDYEADASIANGFTFSMDLVEARTVKPAYVSIPPKPKTQVKPKTNAGKKQSKNKKTDNVYHTVKKGDTYYALSRKYGISLKQIQSWNDYPARSIPIGVKLRVG